MRPDGRTPEQLRPVSFELNTDGGLRMQQFSRDHVGQIMASLPMHLN